MNKPARITVSAEIDARTHDLLQQVVAKSGRSEAEFVAEAVQRAAENKAEYLAFIQVGIDAADRGDVVSQEEMERWFEERIAQRAAG